MTLKNTGNSCSPSQTVKLSGWSHGPSCALSHDQAHVPSPDHDSSPLMTRHVVSPLSFLSISHTCDWLPQSPLVVLYSYHQPHFWLDATLSFSFSYPYCFALATLLTGPHTPYLSIFILSLPSLYKHGLCALVCAHPSSYINL